MSLVEKFKQKTGKEPTENGYWFSTHIENEPNILYVNDLKGYKDFFGQIKEDIGKLNFCKSNESKIFKELSRGIYESLGNDDFKDILIEFDNTGNYVGIAVINDINKDNNQGFYIDYLCSISPGTGSKILNKIKKFIMTTQNNIYRNYIILLSPLPESVTFYLSQKFEPFKYMKWNKILDRFPSTLTYQKKQSENIKPVEFIYNPDDDYVDLYTGAKRNKNGLTRRKKHRRRQHGTQKRFTSNFIKRTK